MGDVYATAGALLLLCWLWRWFVHCVHRNRLDRRQYYDPPISGAWQRPQRFH